MTAVIETRGLGKKYGGRRGKWALTDCTLTIPAGHVVGLVGPNGAGKTTLLNLATGMLAPSTGSIEVLGSKPAASAAQLARVGFVAQDTPVYTSLSVEDHLRFGAHLNPGWDAALAHRRIDQLDLDPRQKAGQLSGGQRAQLALTLAIAKRPELLILDEPIASLDPLARREFLQVLMEATAESGISVVMSSHLVADLERISDYLVVLVSSQVRLAGETDDLLATHHLLTGARCDAEDLPAVLQVIAESHTDRQSTFLVRSGSAGSGILGAGALGLDSLSVDSLGLDTGWSVAAVGLEDLVLAYLGPAATAGRGRILLEVPR
jgi:ABC-2 type transport system ATP-binding protein